MKKICILVFGLASSFTALTAHAAPGDFYAGVGYNLNTFASGPRIFGGYTILKDRWNLAGRPISLGVEATYLDIGTGWISTYVKDHETGVFATAVGTMHIMDRLDVLARAGLGEARGELTDTFYGIGSTSTGTEPMLGVGATYTFQPNFGVRADLEHYSGRYQSADALTASVYASF